MLAVIVSTTMASLILLAGSATNPETYKLVVVALVEVTLTVVRFVVLMVAGLKFVADKV